ncbi:hypothetical protein ACW6QP_06805 [Salegentibacter sp. HM20]
MKISKFFLSLAFVAAMMISCEPEELPQDEQLIELDQVNPVSDNGEESNPPAKREVKD